MKQANKWLKNCICILAILLASCAIIMIVFDPFFHYHGPIKGFSYRLFEDRYMNDGISRHFDFDAIITGTSMSQNFKPSEFDQLFSANSVKESFSGAGYQELSDNLERALKRNPDIKQVLWVIDFNGLMREPNWIQYDNYPTYLYDENPFNDAPYLFNKDILYHGVLRNLGFTLMRKPSMTMDEYSSWEKETGLEAILSSYSRESIVYDPNATYTPEKQDIVYTTITQNFVQLINQYPDVQFYLFYSPYSICHFDALNIEGSMEANFHAMEDATKLLLECPNVKLYDFFDQYHIITDTDLYCDAGHYCSAVNSMILQWIHSDTDLLTKENYHKKIWTEYEFYHNYDYDFIYQD